MESNRSRRFAATIRTLAWLAVTCVPVAMADAAESDAVRPNVLIVLADDLGFADLGCYGGDIATPTLDRLAAEGIRGTSFYNTGRCWPTRASILMGHYAQSVRRDKVAGLEKRTGNGPRAVPPAWATHLTEQLRAAGYRTYHSGKWHLDATPLARGFDRSYWLKDQSRFFSPQRSFVDDELQPPVPPGGPEQPFGTGFYGTDAIADHAVACLADHAAAHAEQPFFSYVAFTAPHFPLHARADDIARYDGRFDDGWNAARQRRLSRQRELGLHLGPLSPPLTRVGPPYDFPDQVAQFGPGELTRALDWSTLTDVQRAFQADKMEIHAAMVDRMDQQLGRIVAQLEAMGELDDTLVVFLSDNGASAELMVRGDGHDRSAPMGSQPTHLCLGPGWSMASNTPFAYHKTWVHEGGIATPLVVRWPRRLPSDGRWVEAIGHTVDLWPTIVEATGIAERTAAELRDDPNARPAPPRPGLSQLDAWSGGQAERAAAMGTANVSQRALWWSHEGNRAVRIGRWKLVAANPERSETGTDTWQLYDLSTDRTETRDLAAAHPDRVAEMAAAWAQIEATTEMNAR